LNIFAQNNLGLFLAETRASTKTVLKKIKFGMHELETHGHF